MARDAPELDYGFSLTGTPSGGLLTLSHYPHLTIWRADGLESGDFTRVVSSGVLEALQADPGLRAVGDRLFLNLGDLVLASDDDGRTWSAVSTWR